ncbi:MAG: hypothetical protein IJE07_08370 [Clostridia bacterium]|nr:hypothetical protein [Clostridia bacterium]
MKHITRLLALLLLLCSVTAACAQEPLAQWPWDQSAPNQIVHAGPWWYAATGLYGSPNASLAIGPSPDALRQVYASQGSIWGMLRATETHAAWVECLNGTFSWMLHTRETGETIAVYTEAMTDERPCFFVGLDEADLYYVRHADNRIEVVRRHLADGTETVLPTPHDAIITSLSLDDGEVTIACELMDGMYLIRLDSVTGEEIAREALPEDVDYVFCAGYVPRYRAYAVYLASETEGEALGFCQNGQLSIVLTIGANSYAYHDYVLMADGHLIATMKIERSGAVADNFITLDIDLIGREMTEYEGAVSFTVDDGRLLLLTLDPDNDRILLEQAW